MIKTSIYKAEPAENFNQDDYVDTALSTLWNAYMHTLTVWELPDETGKLTNNKPKGYKYGNILSKLGLTNYNGDYISVSEFGEQVMREGGWLNYLKNQQAEKERLLEKENLEKESLRSTISKNKYDRKISIAAIIISILSLLVAAFALFFKN